MGQWIDTGETYRGKPVYRYQPSGGEIYRSRKEQIEDLCRWTIGICEQNSFVNPDGSVPYLSKEPSSYWQNSSNVKPVSDE